MYIVQINYNLYSHRAFLDPLKACLAGCLFFLACLADSLHASHLFLQ